MNHLTENIFLQQDGDWKDVWTKAAGCCRNTPNFAAETTIKFFNIPMFLFPIDIWTVVHQLIQYVCRIKIIDFPPLGIFTENSPFIISTNRYYKNNFYFRPANPGGGFDINP